MVKYGNLFKNLIFEAGTDRGRCRTEDVADRLADIPVGASGT